MTGLLASSSLGQSDAFMCGNYGIGGYYGVHPDYNRYDERKFRDAASGINRISTVMTVLEQPAAGGATVFPYLGIANFPEQGSGVWWYNTRSDAHVDQMTQHMACPVLLGQKWSESERRSFLYCNGSNSFPSSWKQVDSLCGPVEKKAVWPRVQLQNPRDLQMKAWRLHKRAVVKGTNCDKLRPLELGIHNATYIMQHHSSFLAHSERRRSTEPSCVALEDLFEFSFILSASASLDNLDHITDRGVTDCIH